jgi:hypothetical protein
MIVLPLFVDDTDGASSMSTTSSLLSSSWAGVMKESLPPVEKFHCDSSLPDFWPE